MVAVTGRDNPLTYRAAGVDLDLAADAVARIADRARRTFGQPDGGGDAMSPATGIGHFGGLFHLPGDPVRTLVASADGVGTKLKLAFVLGGEAHAGIGRDLVNHCVNDILALGARPLFFLDYVAMGTLDAGTLDAVVGGMIDACQANGLVLLGGETAEMPGMYAPGEYDLAGFIVGEVPGGRAIDGSAIEAGDVLVGLPSEGLHTNGYSLARQIIGLDGDREHDRAILAAPLPGGDGLSLGAALMAPHRSYAPEIRSLLDRGWIRGMAHVTGGGLPGNVPRMLPPGLNATFESHRWDAGPLCDYLVTAGELAPGEAARTFNMGIGFVVAVPADVESDILAALPTARRIGRVVSTDDRTQTAIGGYPQW